MWQNDLADWNIRRQVTLIINTAGQTPCRYITDCSSAPGRVLGNL